MRANRRCRRAARFAQYTAVAVAAVLLGGVPVHTPTAAASPIADKQAEAKRLASEIADNGDRIAALGERYDGATLQLHRADAALAVAQRRMNAAQRAADDVRSQVKQMALVAYTGGNSSTPLSMLDVASANDLALRGQYSKIAANRDRDVLSRLRASQEDLAVERKALNKQRAAAQHQQATIAANRQALENANAQQQRLLDQVRGQIAVLVKQEQERQARLAREAALARIRAAQAAAEQAAVVSSGPVGGTSASAVGGDNFPNVPAPSPRVAAVIAYARAQLGKPYQYAATGPNTFDCSGLAMMAWAQAGVSMPHYSGAQYAMFPHVPLSELQPGDLVFRGPGGSEHVAIYVGGGMQIAATHTGDYVRLQPLMSNPVGAARPG